MMSEDKMLGHNLPEKVIWKTSSFQMKCCESKNHEKQKNVVRKKFVRSKFAETFFIKCCWTIFWVSVVRTKVAETKFFKKMLE